MLPILSDADLLRCVAALAPGLADPRACRTRLRIGLRPASLPERGDLSTEAALLAAPVAGRPVADFARQLAVRLARLPGIASAQAAGPGFVNLSFTDAALDRILREAPRGRPALPRSDAPPVPPPPWPLRAMRRRDAAFAAQYAHARCRSVLRAAARLDGLGRWRADELDDAAAGAFAAGAARPLLCRIEHWSRLATPPPSDRPQFDRAIRLFLQDLCGHFDRVWMASADDATLRLLHPAQRSRSLANVALVLATAEVIRSGLSLLGIAAAEEIR